MSERMPNTFSAITEEFLAETLSSLITEASLMDKLGKLNIYLAGPWFTMAGNILYDSVMAIEKAVRKNSNFKVFYPREQANKKPKEAFDNNVNHIKECDIVVALVAEKDVGTAWEIGMAYALGKDIYLVGYDETSFLSHTNLMLAFTGKCFTIDKWAKFLTRGLHNVEYVDIPNVWEGIE